ncbi:MAG: endopeptidase La [Bacteroidota bacterium]
MEFRKGITYLVNTEESQPSQTGEKKAQHNKKENTPKRIPLLPVEEIVLFPHMTFPLKLEKKHPIELIEKIHNEDGYIGLIASKKERGNQAKKDLHNIGTIAKILKIIHLSPNEIVVILQGKNRFSLDKITQKKPHLNAQITPLRNYPFNAKHKRTNVLLQSIKQTAFSLLSHMPDAPSEVHTMIANMQNPDLLVYYIASTLVSYPRTQHILALPSGLKRATLLLKYLLKNLEFLKIQKNIHKKVHSHFTKEQHKRFIEQQIKVLQEELGEDSQDYDEELKELRARAESMAWTPEIKKHFDKTLNKTRRLHPSSAEYTNLINYAHTFLELPWGTYTKEPANLKQAEKILNKEHYGMEKVKERILALLAVQKLKNSYQGRILCFHGPPGVGKTSLCKSIAHALKRKYARISLGGLHDEAELRGHRKTYVGAMIGQILNAIKNAGSSNPLIVLDEIDKLDTQRGNPAAVLLEILDPVQNQHFIDNYLGVPFDLSKVIFIATANDTQTIPHALFDRLEILDLSAYPTEEKIEIAKKHLLPAAREDNGLQPKDLTLNAPTLEYLIEHYTNESGVRELSRQLDILCSKTAKAIVFDKKYPKRIQVKEIPKILGKPRYDREKYQNIEKPGTSIGLAWTPTGGAIFFIEAILYKGDGKLITSGQLGDVMEESALNAFSYLKGHARKLGIPEKIFKEYDLHIHIPDGATPKDGPSAGIALFTAISSLYTQRKIKEKLAMTGEITLRGSVLPVGSIQEKVLAARRAHITDLILSSKNKKDVEEIKPTYIQDLTFHYVEKVDDVVNIALAPKPIPEPAPWLSKKKP